MPDTTKPVSADADEILESNADLEDKFDWLLRNDENMGYGSDD